MHGNSKPGCHVAYKSTVLPAVCSVGITKATCPAECKWVAEPIYPVDLIWTKTYGFSLTAGTPKAEFIAKMIELSGGKSTADDVVPTFHAMDTNKDGLITFAEFKAIKDKPAEPTLEERALAGWNKMKLESGTAGETVTKAVGIAFL